MEQLIAKFEQTCGKKVKETYSFKANGTFKAIREAERCAKEFGYVTGSMCRNEPIGIANAEDYSYIEKWRNLSDADRCSLDGGILSDDFREGDVILVIF